MKNKIRKFGIKIRVLVCVEILGKNFENFIRRFLSIVLPYIMRLIIYLQILLLFLVNIMVISFWNQKVFIYLETTQGITLINSTEVFLKP